MLNTSHTWYSKSIFSLSNALQFSLSKTCSLKKRKKKIAFKVASWSAAHLISREVRGQRSQARGQILGAGNKAQSLRGLSFLQQEPGLIPACTRQLTPICNSSCRGSDTLFWCLQALHIHSAQAHTRHIHGAQAHTGHRQNTHTHGIWTAE